MELKLELGYIPNASKQTRVPYWFTADKAIHLSSEDNPVVTLNSDTVSNHQLFQICIGLKMKALQSRQAEEILKLYDIRTKQSINVANVEAVKQGHGNHTNIVTDFEIDLEDKELGEVENGTIAGAVKDSVVVVADKLLQGNVSQISAQISKIENLKTLKTMLQQEQQKDKPRQTILKAIQKRIDVLNEDTPDFNLLKNEKGLVDVVTEEVSEITISATGEVLGEQRKQE